MIEKSNWSYDGGSRKGTGRMRMASTVSLGAGSPVHKQCGSDRNTVENDNKSVVPV